MLIDYRECQNLTSQCFLNCFDTDFDNWNNKTNNTNNTWPVYPNNSWDNNNTYPNNSWDNNNTYPVYPNNSWDNNNTYPNNSWDNNNTWPSYPNYTNYTNGSYLSFGKKVKMAVAKNSHHHSKQLSCSACQEAALSVQSIIAKHGCTEVFSEKVTLACEAALGGEENINLLKFCSNIYTGACNHFSAVIAKGAFTPLKACQFLHVC